MQIICNFSSVHSPYGDGSSSTYSPIIALGEGWAYYMGHYLADQKYGTSAGCQSEQTDAYGYGIFYCPNFPANTIHPHIDVLENFNPNLLSDPFKWIPKGLFYDLWDPANENSFPVSDQVSGYTNQQTFNAFSSSITTPDSYKTNLLNQNGNNQSTLVTSLFSQYGY